MGESEITESRVGIHARPIWGLQEAFDYLRRVDKDMSQQKPLSRSSRIAGRSVWNNRGPASFTGAARAEALDEIQEHPTPPANPIIVEVIDYDSPNEVKTITVVWRYEFECLSRQPGSND
jgi:hypothetical protein